MQDQNQSGRINFTERTDELAHRLRCSLRELAAKIGISQAMLFAYRSGKHEPTLKVWSKLIRAEIVEGIGVDAPIFNPENNERSSNPKDSAWAAGKKIPEPAAICSLQAQIDAIRSQLTPFTLAELESRMKAAGAWPASKSDSQLTPASLWQKYAPGPHL